MNKMIAITIRPGATTAAARLICPFACKIPPPAATRTSAKVPSNSENSRRHSLRGSSKSLRSPNSRVSMRRVRWNAAPSAARSWSICWAVAPPTAPAPCAVPRVPGPSSRLTGTLSAMAQSLHQQHRRSFTMSIASACKSLADGSHAGCLGPSGPNRASISGSGPRPRHPTRRRSWWSVAKKRSRLSASKASWLPAAGASIRPAGWLRNGSTRADRQRGLCNQRPPWCLPPCWWQVKRLGQLAEAASRAGRSPAMLVIITVTRH